MKKITFCLMVACLSFTLQPLQSNATITANPLTSCVSKPTESAETKALLLRLNEINSMDKSNLKSSDKRHLRSEVRSIKHQLKVLGGGVYISVGAIILIALLLIILF